MREPKGNLVSAAEALIWERAAPMGTGKVPAALVWILTLVISQGHRAISAKTSAEAEPANQMAPLYFALASSPARFM